MTGVTSAAFTVELVNERGRPTSNEGAAEVTVQVSTAASPKMDISVDIR